MVIFYLFLTDLFMSPTSIQCIHAKYVFILFKISIHCSPKVLYIIWYHIICLELDDCNEGDVRLVNGTIEREGRLEVCANGVWGQICSFGFVKSAAYVACKQLGYTDTNGIYNIVMFVH